MGIKVWLWGLLGAVVTGVCTGLGAVAIGPDIIKQWDILWPIMVSGGVVGAIAYMRKFPWPEASWDGVERRDTVAKVLVALVALGALSACHPALDVRTNPVGATAYYANGVVKVVSDVQDAIIAAPPEMLPVAKARTAIRATKELGKGAQKLASVLTELDGLTATDAARPGKLAEASAILDTMNTILFDIVKVIDDPALRAKVSALLTETSRVLLSVSAKLR